jgi:putative ABC transport system permease protein
VLVRLIGKNLLQRPLRYALTGFAIVFSVAAVSAVFIFTDGLRATFDELATNIESGYDISVRPSLEFGDDFLAPSVPLDQAGLLDELDGIVAVQPRIVGLGVIPIDGEGEPTLAPSGPNLGVHWGTRNPNTRLFLQSGRAPASSEEFALDIDAFSDGSYELGKRYTVQVPTSIERGRTFTLVGTFTWADPDENALVGARLVAFDETTAVELINGGRGYSDITIVVDNDVDLDVVLADVRAVVNDDLEVLTQAEVLAETQGDFNQILDIFQTVLLVFAIIILFVSSFLIYNVVSNTLGQRIRELGLLRAVGALGSQVTTLMIGEALMLGIIATIVGIPAGMVLAWVLRTALEALGFPDDTGLPLSIWTIVWAVFTGIVITLLAAIWPSIQARRVSPLAALRDGADLNDLHSIRNPPVGAVAILAGIGSLVAAFVLDGWAPRLLLPILSATLIFIGMLLIERRLARGVLFPLGLLLLTITLVGDFSLGETFGLLGAGALVTLLGANQLNPILARPLSRVLGAAPTAVAIGLLGVAFVVLGFIALGVSAFVLVSGVPDAVIDAAGSSVPRAALVLPALLLSLLAPVIGYGMLRTAWGARGLTGQVARANAARNPQRTATTAAALMIGLTLVTAVTVIGDSIKSSVSDALSSSITADWLLSGPSAGPNQVPFATAVRERVEKLDEVDSVLAFRSAFPAAWVTSESGELRADDFQQFLPVILRLLDDDSELTAPELLSLRDQIGTGVEINDAIAVDFETLDDHVDPEFIARDDSLIGPNAVYLVDDAAEDKGLEVGDTFSALFVDLESEDLVVAGIYSNSFVLGPRVMTLDMWDRHFPTDTDQFLTVVTASGVTPDEARSAITLELAEDFPIIEVQDKAEFAEATERQINQTLATINVLLGLSAVIAALGILVALALSVFERTREIGLFRAVGTTRAQTRWMIRWEGVIVASFGGLLGVVLGIALGALATAKMPEVLVTQTTIPFGSLVGYVFLAAVIGLGAAVFPAWIAGRLDVLDAISAE